MRYSIFIGLLGCILIFSCNIGIYGDPNSDPKLEFADYMRTVEKQKDEFYKLTPLKDLTKVNSSNVFSLGQETLSLIQMKIPDAANQEFHVKYSPYSFSRLNVVRDVNKNLLSGKSDGYRLDNILKTAYVANVFGGAMCNEYSAVTFSQLMGIGVDQPIQRNWSPQQHHSFTTIGDERIPKMKNTLVDPWTVYGTVKPFDETCFYNDPDLEYEEWCQRYPGEGKEIVSYHNSKFRSMIFPSEEGKGIRDSKHLKRLKKKWVEAHRDGIAKDNIFNVLTF